MYLSQFKTQKEARDFASNKFKDSMLGITEDQFFYKMIEHHPFKEFKIGCGIKNLEIIRDNYGNKYINIHRLDDTFASISRNACCNNNGKKTYNNLSPAMREAIEDDINLFRSSAILECVFCNSTNNLHVDHIIHFKKLQIDFLSINEAPTTFDKCPITLKSILKEGDFKKKWIEYHKENATLRILCRDCNLGRDKHIVVSDEIKKFN